MMDYIVWAFYATPLFFLLIYSFRKFAHHRRLGIALKQYRAEKMTDPTTLHPIFDTKKCIGCGSCVKACYEDAIQLVNRKAFLVDPAHCIGHGVCYDACPVDALTLVFGTKDRGVDIPDVNSEFQTNVPGIYIAGELGGLGLIKNAIAQGRQALEAVVKAGRRAGSNELDILIVGAGPAGFSATLGAIKNKLRYVTVEQESFGGTVAHFPRGKIVMTQPAELPLAGKFKFTEIKKEPLIKIWHQILKKYRVKINTHERMEKITPNGSGFVVQTSKGTYQTKTVLLALGGRGTPRKLNVPGEDTPKVVYRLVDPAQYVGQHVLVVGGGDSALEAAHTIADENNTTVTLSYRSGSFSRAKPKNREKIKQAEESGKLRVMLNSNVKEIKANEVIIEQEGKMFNIPNNSVIISAGGVMPTGMLKDLGISVETKYGTV